VFLVVIYKGKEVKVHWCLGLDAFAEEEGLFGPSKRYPSGSSITVDGKEVPILFAASENASKNKSILADLFMKMDELGITERDEAEGVRPCALVDDHVSRLGLEFLSYINGVDSLDDYDLEEQSKIPPRWSVVLGQPYGTGEWQPHDHKSQNNIFKLNLQREKISLIKRKRAAGLLGEIEKDEIILIIAQATQASFANVNHSQSTLAATGWNPPTMAPLAS
jgi:hypothetical protein